MEKNPKKPLNYSCENCDFTTSNKKDYNRHLLTRKHLEKQKGDETETPKTPKNPDGHSCVCGKQYACYGSLWRHKKSCVGEPKETPNQSIPTEMVIELIKQNKELQAFIINELKRARS